jgi:predicted nucleotidyltransferase
MPKQPTDAELTEAVRTVLTDYKRVQFCYLFGSTARDDARPDSDIDLAVLASPSLSLIEEAALHEGLAKALDRSLDLVMLNRAPLWLQFRILGEGRVLFSRDEPSRVAFRERVEKTFLDFRPFHDEYLLAIRQRARRGALTGG